MRRSRRHSAMDLQLKGYRLSTAEITYHMPDHRDLLQTFIWQHYDIAPDYPELHRFLDFWVENLDAPLHSVRVMHAGLVRPARIRAVDSSFSLH